MPVDAAAVVPTVAKPHTVDNTAAAAELGGVKVDQVLIGTCTNGRLADLRSAARAAQGPPSQPRHSAHRHAGVAGPWPAPPPPKACSTCSGTPAP